MSSLFLSSPKLVDRANQCVHVGRPSGTALKPSAQVHAANKLDGESDNAPSSHRAADDVGRSRAAPAHSSPFSANDMNASSPSTT